ncbi:uncharacterized protein LOC111087826 [Limulus polyphemus]|uniref:Uncharacterized protein LOC111087826 n=1 Tax=Limulus polyphemus TaxID=6850 RepID=A0ABM1T6R7_LIMPO|nr:uncharacterized protein LOC111087826 [Limulus polyphemus]
MSKNKHEDEEVSEFGIHKTKYSKETITQNAHASSPIVHVHKSFTIDDVVELSGADGDFNDASDVDVRSDSDQHFSDGELVSSGGHTVISVYHRPNGDKRRKRRRNVDDGDGNDQSLEDLYTANMDYKLELQEKKPYLQEPDFVGSKVEVLKLHAATLISETSREKADLEAVNNLEQKIGHPYKIVKQLLRAEGDEFEEKVEKVMQIVGLEHQLPDSMSSKKWVRAVQSTFTSKVLKRTCSLADFQRCLTVLQLITLTGGVRAETVVFEYLTLASGVKFSEEQQLLVIRLLESIDNPSKNFIRKILKYYQDLRKKKSSLANHLLEGLGSLGSRVKFEDFIHEMKLILQQELKDISDDSCRFSDKMTHVFKSIGNWANPIMISDVITFANKCPKEFAYKVLAVEGLQHLSHMEEVQEWLLQAFKNEDCEVQQKILKIIGQQLSSVHDNRLYGRLKSVARRTFTYLDEYLGFVLLNTSESYINCPSFLEDIYDYLEIKSAQQAKEIIFQVNEKAFQFTSSVINRQKRWTSKNCHSWNFNKDYEIIQSKNEFENDNNLYSNKNTVLLISS